MFSGSTLDATQRFDGVATSIAARIPVGPTGVVHSLIPKGRNMHTDSRPRRTRWAIAALALGLLSGLGFAQTEKLDPQKKFDAIQERYETAQKDFMKSLRAAKEEDMSKLYEKRPGLEFVAEFKALGTEAKGTDVGAHCWIQVAQISADFGKNDDAIAAADVLMKEYVESPAISELPMMLGQMSYAFGPDSCETMLRDLVKKSPHKSVQAPAVFQLAQLLMGSNDEKANDDKEAGEKAAARKAEGRTLFERIQSDYADVKTPWGKNYGEMASGFLFELDNLQIGKTAPDFEVTDENGVKFKLSDYRGKVVVVDFWGHW